MPINLKSSVSPFVPPPCRQASLNEAAERQYERAAGLRPDVSNLLLQRLFALLTQKCRCQPCNVHFFFFF